MCHVMQDQTDANAGKPALMKYPKPNCSAKSETVVRQGSGDQTG